MLLSQLTKVQSGEPIMATFFGEGGMGKTTLAAMFPKPAFFRIEDGTKSIAGHPDALVTPHLTSTHEVFSWIGEFIRGEHDRKTIIFDSISQFEKLAVKETLESEQNPRAKNMEAAHGGYGKAWGLVDAKHQQLREAAGDLQKARGVNIVFIAHAKTEEMDLPDIDKYSRYTIELKKNKQFNCVHHYSNNVDLVAFIRLKTIVKTDSNKAISNEGREIICFPVASNISKNRFDIAEPIPFDLSAGNPFDRWTAK